MTPDELMRQAHLQDEVERLVTDLRDATRELIACRSEAADLTQEKGTAVEAYRSVKREAKRARARIAELEAVLAAARDLVDEFAPGRYDFEDVMGKIVALNEAVRAADATPPTERAESHADAPNPRDQGQNP